MIPQKPKGPRFLDRRAGAAAEITASRVLSEPSEPDADPDDEPTGESSQDQPRRPSRVEFPNSRLASRLATGASGTGTYSRLHGNAES